MLSNELNKIESKTHISIVLKLLKNYIGIHVDKPCKDHKKIQFFDPKNKLVILNVNNSDLSTHAIRKATLLFRKFNSLKTTSDVSLTIWRSDAAMPSMVSSPSDGSVHGMASSSGLGLALLGRSGQGERVS